MKSRRMAKIARAIQETVSSTVLFELRDPRIQNVTVLSAEPTEDLTSAKVYVSVMGDPKTQSLCIHGLNSARGFIQSKIADRLQTRNTPILTFILDESVKRSIEAARLLREALPPAPEEENLLTEDETSIPGAEQPEPESDEDLGQKSSGEET